MTKQTREQRRTYGALVSQAQGLSTRVSNHQGAGGFDDFVAEHNQLLRRYISGFNSLSLKERQSGEYILNAVKSLIHSTLDVYRVREMRNVPIPKSEKR